MTNRKHAVVFMAHCYPSGLIFHWAHLACEMFQVGQPDTFDLYICSHHLEQYKGSWNRLRQGVPAERIMTVSDFDQSVFQAVDKLLTVYDRVVVHYGGGYHLLKPLVKLKQAYRQRVHIIAITQSYRHDHWLRMPVSAHQYLLYRKYVDYVVFQCPYAARRFVGGNWFLNHNRGGFIPLGVEPFTTEQLTTRPDEEVGTPDIRPLLESPEWFNFVFLAQVRPGKGQHWLLETLRPVLRRYDRVRMYFLGGGGPLFDELQHKVKIYGLENQVICPGTVPRKYVPWILAQCHAGLIPTRAETFGHCFSEPAMAGLPIVGTRVGVGEYLIQDMLTGIGFAYGDQAAVRDAVRYLASHRQEAKRMGATMQSMVAKAFLHQNVANAYLQLYDRLLMP